MKSLLAPVRCIGGLDRVDLAVQLLEDEWRRHGEVDLKRLWTEQKRSLAVEKDDSVVLLVELIKTDLRCRYAGGVPFGDRIPRVLLGVAGSRQPGPEPDLRAVLPG